MSATTARTAMPPISANRESRTASRDSPTHRFRIDPHRHAPVAIGKRRDLRRLDLAPPAPEDVRVRDRNADTRQVLVDGPLVREHGVLLRPVRDSHDVHVAELVAALAPVTVGEDVK